MCLKVHKTWVMNTKEERIESCVNLCKEIEKEFRGKYCTLMLTIMVMLSPPHLEKFTFFSTNPVIYYKSPHSFVGKSCHVSWCVFVSLMSLTLSFFSTSFSFHFLIFSHFHFFRVSWTRRYSRRNVTIIAWQVYLIFNICYCSLYQMCFQKYPSLEDCEHKFQCKSYVGSLWDDLVKTIL